MSSPRSILLALPALLGFSMPLPAAVTPELVKDIATNEQGANITPYVSMGSYVLFQGVDLAHGSELWKSDGTPAGTSLLADIWPGPNTGTSSNMARAGNLCFFSANSGNRTRLRTVEDGWHRSGHGDGEGHQSHGILQPFEHHSLRKPCGFRGR
jgi:ELWxxDGT repeat protein